MSQPTTSPETAILSGAEILWATLEGEGVREVFGYPGGAILPVYDALRHFPIRHILVRHEQSAVHMADGFARATGQVGVAIATSGPGATNMVTGIANAMLDSVPVVCITGQVSSKVLGSDAFQEVDITGITLPVTKHNYVVTRAEDIAPAVREAFRVARSGRPGPVLVDITKDAQQGKAAYSFAAAAPRPYRPHPMQCCLPREVEEAARLIRAAQRPLLLAGHGVLRSGALEQVRTVVERCQVPLAWTLLGAGALPASHPMNLGMMGMHGESWVNEAIQNADLLLAFGMRFDDRVTGTLASYAPQAKKIHIDIDPAEINKNVRVDVALTGDLATILDELLPRLPAKNHDAWLNAIHHSKGSAAVRDITALPDNGHLYAAHVIHDLWRSAGAHAVVATDVGQHQMWAAQYFKHEGPRSNITSGGLGTMGFALPAGIGARVGCDRQGHPEREVWVIAGDGGFQMTQAELATLAQEQLNVNIAIINNGFLGMVRQWQEFFYEKNYESSPILSPDFALLAAAYGIPAATVRTRAEVAPALAAARAVRGPYLINFLVEKEDSVYPMIPAGAALHEMIRRPDNPLVETASDV